MYIFCFFFFFLMKFMWVIRLAVRLVAMAHWCGLSFFLLLIMQMHQLLCSRQQQFQTVNLFFAQAPTHFSKFKLIPRRFARFYLCVVCVCVCLQSTKGINHVWKKKKSTTSAAHYSLEGFSFGTQRGCDHLTVDSLNVWNLADHHRPILLLRR